MTNEIYEHLRQEIIRCDKAERVARVLDVAAERGKRAIKTLLKLESLVADLRGAKKRNRSIEEEVADSVQYALETWDDGLVGKLRMERDCKVWVATAARHADGTWETEVVDARAHEEQGDE